MITTQDQEELFALISRRLTTDITCYAIGGTAMMFYKYKNTTKDINLVFNTAQERAAFIAAIEELGYKEMSLKGIYDKKRQAGNVPLLFTRGDERFDLFLHEVFGFTIPPGLEITQRHDFPQQLTVNILPIEYLVLLKAITGRERDYEDIETILSFEKNLDWGLIVDLALAQKKGNSWILVDLEETLQRLKEKVFIPEKFFEQLYKAQE